LELADRAYQKKLYAASARLFGEASSTLVGEDIGGEAEKPITDADRAKLRDPARAWLDAELATWTKLLGIDGKTAGKIKIRIRIKIR
jgi:hypothetical protein